MGRYSKEQYLDPFPAKYAPLRDDPAFIIQVDNVIRNLGLTVTPNRRWIIYKLIFSDGGY